MLTVPVWLQVLSARLPGDSGLLGTHARALEAFARLVPARPELLPRIIQKVLARDACSLRIEPGRVRTHIVSGVGVAMRVPPPCAIKQATTVGV